MLIMLIFFPVLVSYECVHCLTYSIQREALQIRSTSQFSYCTIQNGRFGAKIARPNLVVLFLAKISFLAQFYREKSENVGAFVGLCLYIYIYMCGWYLQGLCGNFGFRKNDRKRSAKWSSQIRNALFPRNFAGTNCKYCKNKDFVGLWCAISNIAGRLKTL